MASFPFPFSSLFFIFVFGMDYVITKQDPPQPNPTCPPNDAQRNKILVVIAYLEAFKYRKLDNLEAYFHTDYIQHNYLIADGLEALKDFVRSIPENDGIPDIKRAGADGDLVWLHIAKEMFGIKNAIVDIFRVECGKIKEHWDVTQNTNITSSANPHPFW